MADTGRITQVGVEIVSEPFETRVTQLGVEIISEPFSVRVTQLGVEIISSNAAPPATGNPFVPIIQI